MRVTTLAMALGLLMLGMCGCGGTEEPESRPNIVLVVLDTLRDDHVGMNGWKESLTPTLDQLVANGTSFPNAWSTAPWTVPSHASMFTGLLPSAHACTHHYPRLAADRTTLAQMLSAAGYETAAFYSNHWLSDAATDLLRGFVHQQEAPMLGGLPDDPGRWPGDQGGRASIRHLAAWLREKLAIRAVQENPSPFFLFVNFLEPHLPYDPPVEIRDGWPDGPLPDGRVTNAWAFDFNARILLPQDVDLDRVQRLYAGDVAVTDQLLGSLLETLTAAGCDEETVVIVTSDHGENLGDHGLAEHQFSLHETLLAVPLVIRAPGKLPPGVRNDPVMLTDLYATILDLAGLRMPGSRPHSRSLLRKPAPAERPVVAEYQIPNEQLLAEIIKLNPQIDLDKYRRALRTIRKGDLRLTVASSGEIELHDLGNDPAQQHNLAQVRPDEAMALMDLLVETLPEYRPPAEAVELDEATRVKLRSLGYVH